MGVEGDDKLGFGEKVGKGAGRSEYRGGDYYEFIARAPSIRPICVAEGEGLSEKSSSSLAYWWATTFLKFLSIIILSVRTDRLSDSTYLASHWKHYGGMLAFALLAWMPQVCDSLGLVYFSLTSSSAYIACIFGLFYYILSISFYFLHLAPWLRKRLGTATTLKIWEYYVSVAWQVQTLGFWALTICPLPETSVTALAPIPTWVTTGVGLVLVVFGIGSKMGAIYGTGYNTYYWYDMVTDIPNAYFVEVGIYKWHGSPTYTLGRGTSFGAALLIDLCQCSWLRLLIWPSSTSSIGWWSSLLCGGNTFPRLQLPEPL